MFIPEPEPCLPSLAASPFTFKVIRERVLLLVAVACDRKIARLSPPLFALGRVYEARIGGGLHRAAVVQSPRLRLNDRHTHCLDSQFTARKIRMEQQFDKEVAGSNVGYSFHVMLCYFRSLRI